MRHLVACRTCHRQFDATGLSPGSSFACSCGARVAVQAALAHDAAVVRCSSCGAAREAGEPACGWCGSEFTLHERDLHTICPQCATRMSDRARHCHACGVAVEPQPPGAGDPALCCPACAARPALVSRALAGGSPLLECDRCAGMWVTPAELRGLVMRAREGTAALRRISEALQPAREPGPDQASGGPGPLYRPPSGGSGPLYRPCVRCGQRMNRTRFAGGTTVVVDYCREHGVWFDGEELPRALAQVLEGQGIRDTDPAPVLPGDRERARELDRLRRETAWRKEGPLAPDRFGGGHDLPRGARLALGVLEAALRLFA